MELQKEITGTIEAQVQRLIEQARRDTESKVKMELKTIHDAMVVIDQTLDNLIVQLDSMEPQATAEPPMDAEVVGQLLSKVEQQWGQEIRTLKQELHQTILAHNHNADLIKHHKDTIDALRERAIRMQNSKERTSEVQQNLQKLDAKLKQQQQKQKKLEPLFERLTALEQKVNASAGAWARYGGGAPPALPPGIPPAVMPGMLPGMSSAQMQMMAAMRSGKAGTAAAAAQAHAAAAYAAANEEAEEDA